jgi:hypothetical protein
MFTGTAITPVEGVSFAGSLGSFSDASATPDISDFSATIAWGDGAATAGTIQSLLGGGFSVNGSHVYAEEGSYVPNIFVQDVGGQSTSGATQAAVSDAPLSATSIPFTVTEGASTGTISLATFTDADANGTAGDYTASIDWGDGSSTNGTISGSSGGSFGVSGSHTYADNLAGNTPYTVTVSIADAGGSSTMALVPATVLNVAPDVTALTPNPDDIVAGGSTTVAGSFTDPGVLDSHTVDIDWGDSTTHTVLGLAATALSFSSTHVYAAGGAYTVTATVADKDGGTGSLLKLVTVHPNVPSTPDLADASDSGISNTDNITNVNRPTFTGTADPNVIVTLYEAALALGSGLSDSTGDWSITLANPLADGSHSIRARATAGGVDSRTDSAALTIAIDTVAPTGTFTIDGTIIDGQLATNDPALTLNLSYADDPTGSGLATIAYSVDGGVTTLFTDDYPLSTKLGALVLPGPDGLYPVAVTVYDVAGNASTLVTQSIRLDTTGPAISETGLTNGSSLDLGQTVVVTYGATDVDNAEVTAALSSSSVTQTCGTDATQTVSCQLTFSTDTLSAGTHTLTLSSTDALGNTATTVITFQVHASVAGLVSAVHDGVGKNLIDSNMATPLIAKLQAAQAAINRGDNATAKSLLQSFISQVAAQGGKKIDASYAGLLIGWAADLISRL